LKVSDRVQGQVKEGKLLSSGSRNNLEEQVWEFCKIFLTNICVKFPYLLSKIACLFLYLELCAAEESRFRYQHSSEPKIPARG